MAPPEIFLAPSLAPPLFKRCFVNFYHLLRKGFCQVSEFDGLTFSQDLNVSSSCYGNCYNSLLLNLSQTLLTK